MSRGFRDQKDFAEGYVKCVQHQRKLRKLAQEAADQGPSKDDCDEAKASIQAIETFCDKARSPGITLDRMTRRGLMDGLEAFRQFCEEAKQFFRPPEKEEGSSK